MNQTVPNGWQATAKFNSSEIVQVLLDKGADVNVKDNRSWTALMLAEEVPNNDAIIQMLKKAGAK
jgi:ankyrin repeat protein